MRTLSSNFLIILIVIVINFIDSKRLVCRDAKMPVSTQREGDIRFSTRN